jgi:hypothetical protein
MILRLLKADVSACFRIQRQAKERARLVRASLQMKVENGGKKLRSEFSGELVAAVLSPED